MKNIKNWKLFESTSNLNDIVDNCKDILIDISDLKDILDKNAVDLIVVKSREVINYAKYIYFKVITNIDIEKYTDDLIRINEYLETEGFEIREISGRWKDKVDFKSGKLNNSMISSWCEEPGKKTRHYQNFYSSLDFNLAIKDILNKNLTLPSFEYIKYDK